MASVLLKRQAVIDLALGWTGPMRAKALAPARQKIDIEALLRWTYLQELPKVPRAPDAPAEFRAVWDKVSQMGEELSLAGLDQNSYGVVSDFFARDLPHNDALVVHAAVCALDELEVAGLEDFSPFDAAGEAVTQSLLDQCAARARDRLLLVGKDGKARLRKPLRQMVFTSAILGNAPDWEIGAFSRDFERWENGMVKYFKRGGYWQSGAFGDQWIEYETAVAGRTSHSVGPEEYPREILMPDPCDDGVSRMQHELWRLALDVVEADLIGRLEKWDVTPCLRPHRPWIEGELRRGRVLRDLTQPTVIRMELRRRSKKSCRNGLTEGVGLAHLCPR